MRIRLIHHLLVVGLGAVLVAGCGSSAGGPEPTTKTPDKVATETANPEVPENLVRLYLLADVTAISPGQEFRLAARFDVEPTWHVYWTNPGEAGLPTTATFELPAGYTATAPAYPGPKTFDGGGGVTSYGYDDLLLLTSQVTAPDTLTGKQELKVSASWLACREMCIPGEAEATMSLPAASATEPSGPANAPMFAANDAALPTPLAASDGAVSWNAEQRAVEIWLPGAKKAEYYPSIGEQTALAGQIAIPGEDGVKLVLSYKKDAPAPIQVRGVLARSSETARHFHQIEFDPPN